MAHLLDLTKGEGMAYIGKTPWHQMGNIPDDPSDLENWIKCALIDWDISEKDVYFQVKDNETVSHLRRIKGKKALIRSDTQQALSIVGKNFKYPQPREVVYFFEDMIKEHGFEMTTMGGLDEGRRIWASARTGQDFKIGQDAVEMYLLFATAYDGTFSNTIQFTSTSVVCNNTLQAAFANGQNVIKVPHSVEFDAQEVKTQLGLLDGAVENFQSNVIKLSEIHIGKEQAIEFFMDLMGYGDKKENAKATFTVKKLLECYSHSPGAELESRKDTAWGLVNAVTYFTDHQRRAKNDDTRFRSSQFGASAILKNKAFDSALQLAQVA